MLTDIELRRTKADKINWKSLKEDFPYHEELLDSLVHKKSKSGKANFITIHMW